jgi:hypothetical protein
MRAEQLDQERDVKVRVDDLRVVRGGLHRKREVADALAGGGDGPGRR